MSVFGQLYSDTLNLRSTDKSNALSIAAHDTTTNYTLKFPAAAGNTDEFLTQPTLGALAWSSTLKVSDGLVGTPSLSFSSDITTGFYTIGGGDINVSVVGSKVATFTGTNTANQHFDILGTEDAIAIDTGSIRTAGGMSITKNLYVGVDAVIAGDLTVTGTTSSVNVQDLNVTNQHVFLSNGYTTNAGQSGGIVVNYLPTTATQPTTAGGFTTNLVNVDNSTSTFSNNDIIQVSGAANPANNGIYVVATQTATSLTIKSTHSFAQTLFEVDGTDTSAVITKINVSVLQSGTSGSWEVGSGSVDTFTFNALATDSGSSALSGTTLSLTDETAQIVFDSDGANPLQINAATQATARSFTIPQADAGSEFVMTTGAQTLTGKALTSVSALSLKKNDAFENNMFIALDQSTDINADRTLTISVEDNDRSIVLGGNLNINNGNLNINNSFTTSGGGNIAFLSTGSTTATLPAGTSTLVSETSTSTLINKTIVKKITTGITANPAIFTDIMAFDSTFAFTVILPTTDFSAGLSFMLYLAVAGQDLTIIVAGGSGDTIDDGIKQQIILNTQYQRVTLTAVGTVWLVT
jgi:hypothetical protein